MEIDRGDANCPIERELLLAKNRVVLWQLERRVRGFLRVRPAVQRFFSRFVAGSIRGRQPG